MADSVVSLGRMRIWSKIWVASLMAFGLLSGISCEKDDGEVLFELNFPPPPITFTIQPGLSTTDTHIYSQNPIATHFNQLLTNSGHTIDEVGTIQAKEAYLTSIFEDVNLDFIHRVTVFVFDPFNPDDKIEFFYLDPVPFKDKTTIQLFPGITDIKDWMKEEFIGIEVRLDFRQISPALIDMELEFDVRVYSR